MCVNLDLSSAKAKFERAQFHLVEANAIYARFIKDNPYEIFKCDYGDGWHGIGISRLKEWPAELSLVLGDAANCLRATLAHIAFACVPKHADSEEDQDVRFPICTTTHQFKSTTGKFRDRLIPNALSLFKRFQPGPSPQFPAARFLTLVDKVNNRDKHRALSLISGRGKRTHFSITPSDGAIEYDDPIEGRLQIGTILKHFKLSEGLRREEVQVQITNVVVPIFSEGMPELAVGESAITAFWLAFEFIRDEIFPAFSKL